MIRHTLLTMVVLPLIGCNAIPSPQTDSVARDSERIVSRNSETSHVKQVLRLSAFTPTRESSKEERPEFVVSTTHEFSSEIVPVGHHPEPAPFPEETGVSDLLLETIDEPVAYDDGALSLIELENLALEHNPSISQISASAQKIAGFQHQVGLKPNPQFGYFADEMGNESDAGLQGAYVSQMFVTGDKLNANRCVLQEDYQSILWEVEAQRFRVKTDVRTAFYEALAAQKRLQLARDFRTVAEKGLSVAQDRLKAQEGAMPDVLQAEIQLSEIDIILQRAEVEYDAAWNNLITIVGLPSMTPSSLAGELPAMADNRDFELLYQQLLESSPELQAAQTRVSRAVANLHRQDLQTIPNITGQLGVGRDDATGNGFANLQVSMPLPIRNRNEGNIQAAYAEYARATHDVERLELALRSRLIRAMREYNQSRVSVNQYASVILPKAKQNMDLSDQAHIAGQFDFLRVLVARRTYFETNLAYVKLRAELAKAEAQIDGLLLSGGLNEPMDLGRDDSLRGQALSGQ